MQVVPKDFLRDVPDNLTNGLLPGTAFGELCDQRVAMVVPPAGNFCTRPNVPPRCLERRHMPSRIPRPRSTEREDIPIVPNLLEFLEVGRTVLKKCLLEHRVDGDRPSLSRGSLALSDLNIALVQVNLAPGK